MKKFILTLFLGLSAASIFATTYEIDLNKANKKIRMENDYFDANGNETKEAQHYKFNLDISRFLNKTKPKTGDQIHVVGNGTVDKEVKNLTIHPVDNSQVANWWKLLVSWGNGYTVKNISAGEEYSFDFILTLTENAESSEKIILFFQSDVADEAPTFTAVSPSKNSTSKKETKKENKNSESKSGSSNSEKISSSTFHVGGAAPLASLSDNSRNDFSSSGFDFYADFTRILENGFTFYVNATAGVVTASASADGLSDDIDMTDFSFGAGLGYSFIHDEKKNLSLTGEAGIEMLSGNKNIYTIGTQLSKLDVSTTVFYIGPKISFTYKFASHFGIFANAGLYFATGSNKFEVKDLNLSSEKSISGVLFRPEFGVAIPL